VRRSAELSPCGLYRFSLTREWDMGQGTVLFIMLNPSTADAEQDDPTIRRCIGFAITWGMRRLEVRNLFAYRATDPRELLLARRRGVDIIGRDNVAGLLFAASNAIRVICAWGAHPIAEHRGPTTINMLIDAGVKPEALDLTRAMAPKHPLYVPSSASPVFLKRRQ